MTLLDTELSVLTEMTKGFQVRAKALSEGPERALARARVAQLLKRRRARCNELWQEFSP